MNFTTTIPLKSYNSSTDGEPFPKETISLFLGVPIFIENLAAIFILSKCEKLMYQVRLLSLNLCLADCLTGLMLMVPRSVFEFVFSCKLKKYFNLMAIISSMLTATAINVDRSLSIYLNMKYREVVTKRFVRATCLVTWIISLPLSYALFFTPDGPLGIDCSLRSEYSRQISNIATRVVLQVILLVNLGLFVYMIRFTRKVAPVIPEVILNACEVHQIQPETAKMLKKILLISGCLLVCVSPVLIMRDTETVLPDSPVVSKIIYITEILIISKSFINPLLYIWTFYEVKYQIKRVVFFWNARRLEEIDNDRKQHFASFDIATVPRKREELS